KTWMPDEAIEGRYPERRQKDKLEKGEIKMSEMSIKISNYGYNTRAGFFMELADDSPKFRTGVVERRSRHNGFIDTPGEVRYSLELIIANKYGRLGVSGTASKAVDKIPLSGREAVLKYLIGDEKAITMTAEKKLLDVLLPSNKVIPSLAGDKIYEYLSLKKPAPELSTIVRIGSENHPQKGRIRMEDIKLKYYGLPDNPTGSDTKTLDPNRVPVSKVFFNEKVIGYTENGEWTINDALVNKNGAIVGWAQSYCSKEHASRLTSGGRLVDIKGKARKSLSYGGRYRAVYDRYKITDWGPQIPSDTKERKIVCMIKLN
ncbi:MAG: hypothetical protein AABZ57_04140, partial [Candidatus Margulisiibacteriota bacterium]